MTTSAKTQQYWKLDGMTVYVCRRFIPITVFLVVCVFIGLQRSACATDIRC